MPDLTDEQIRAGFEVDYENIIHAVLGRSQRALEVERAYFDGARFAEREMKAQTASWAEALGLLTTLHPTMEIDGGDPMGMAKAVEKHVSIERQDLAACIRRLARVAGRIDKVAADGAMDLLRRKGLQGTVLREVQGPLLPAGASTKEPGNA